MDTASSLQNTFLARLSCLLILNLWWFARSRASVLHHEIFPRAQRFSSCLPPLFCEERMETYASVRYLAYLYDFSFRELQTLQRQSSAQVSAFPLQSWLFSRQDLSTSSWLSTNTPLFLLLCKIWEGGLNRLTSVFLYYFVLIWPTLTWFFP